MAEDDWFAKNAPKDEGDWFEKNAPGVTTSDSNIGPARTRNTLKGPPKRSMSGDVSNLIEGTAKYASGAAIPAALIAPGSTLAGAAGGYAASKTGEAGAKALGASDDQSRLAGDLTGIAGGTAAGKLSEPIGRVVKAVGREATPNWLPRLAEAAMEAWKGTPHIDPADPWAGKPVQAKPNPSRNPRSNPPRSSSDPQPDPSIIQAHGYTPRSSGIPSEHGVLPPIDRSQFFRPLGKTTAATQSPVNTAPPDVPVLNSSRGLAKVLKDAGIKPEDAAKMDEDQWKLAASAAKFSKPPSAVETQQALSELAKMTPAESKFQMNVRRRTKR